MKMMDAEVEVSLRFLDKFKHEEMKKVRERGLREDDPELKKLMTSARRIVSAPQNRYALNIVLFRRWLFVYLLSSRNQWKKIEEGTLDVVFMDPLGGEEYWAKISELRPSL